MASWRPGQGPHPPSQDPAPALVGVAGWTLPRACPLLPSAGGLASSKEKLWAEAGPSARLACPHPTGQVSVKAELDVRRALTAHSLEPGPSEASAFQFVSRYQPVTPGHFHSLKRDREAELTPQQEGRCPGAAPEMSPTKRGGRSRGRQGTWQRVCSPTLRSPAGRLVGRWVGSRPAQAVALHQWLTLAPALPRRPARLLRL